MLQRIKSWFAPRRAAPASVDVFPLLFNRVAREGQLTPAYLGEFDLEGLRSAVDSFPAIYSWLDTANGNFVLSVNTPLLSRWAAEEAARLGVHLREDAPRIGAAVQLLNSTVSESYAQAMSQALNERRHA